MDEPIPAMLRAWETYYLIVGTAAGALTGLQFVVLTLITESGILRGSGASLAAFGSPNVVHFCAALLASAVMVAPWHDLGGPGAVMTVCGVCGAFYSVAVMRRAVRQTDYKPVLEDWTWHAALPLLAYSAWIFGGAELARSGDDAPFFVGGAALLLVFIGIHNAWDTVLYVTIQRARQREAQARALDVVPAALGHTLASGRGGTVETDTSSPGSP
jgi:hypothetical protein